MSAPAVERDGPTLARRLLTYVAAGGLLLALLGVVYVSLTPAGSADPYTEFYVLGPNGTAGEYPTALTAGETGTVTVGISNREVTETRYTVLVVLDGEETGRQSATLDRGETWERDVSVTPTRTGTREVRLLLFEGNAGPPSDARHSLRLWITVSESTARGAS